MRRMLLLLCLGMAGVCWAADAPAYPEAIDTPRERQIYDLLMDWDEAVYRLQGDARQRAYERLAGRTAALNAKHPDDAEFLILEGITRSAWAETAPRLKALKLIRQARALLQRSLAIDPAAMEGSASGTLGALYAKAPGWPISFGDDDKAEDYFQAALRQDPDSIDINFYYAEFLAEQGEEARAIRLLRRALAAPERQWRPIGEAGRRAQIRQLLAELEG